MSNSESKTKSNSKASYVMLIEKLKSSQIQTQIPLSNQFQVLGNIPKPSQTFAQVAKKAQSSKQPPSNYIAKAQLMKIQILESHHFNKSSSLDLTKYFPKRKYFLQNDPLRSQWSRHFVDPAFRLMRFPLDSKLDFYFEK